MTIDDISQQCSDILDKVAAIETKLSELYSKVDSDNSKSSTNIDEIRTKVGDLVALVNQGFPKNDERLVQIVGTLQSPLYGMKRIQEQVTSVSNDVGLVKSTLHSMEGTLDSTFAQAKAAASDAFTIKLESRDHIKDCKSKLQTLQSSLDNYYAQLSQQVKTKIQGFSDSVSQLQSSLGSLDQQVASLSQACQGAYDKVSSAKAEVERSVAATTSTVSASLSALVDSLHGTSTIMTSVTSRVEQLRDVLSTNIDTLLKQISVSLQHFSDIASDKTLQTISVGTEFINQCKVTIASLNQEARTLAFDYAKIAEMKDILTSHEDGVVRANRALSQSLVVIDDKIKQFNALVATATTALQSSEDKGNGLAMVQVALNAISQIPSGLADMKRVSQKGII